MRLMFLDNLAEWVVAQAASDGGGSTPSGLGGLGQLAPLVIMFGIIYFLLIRPASKQRKQHAELLNQLKKDDEVVTSSGIYGRIIVLEDKVATLEIADKVKIRILRASIAGRWNPEAA